MPQQNTMAPIRAYISEHFPGARKRRVGDSDTLLQSGIIDSMGILDLVTHLEEAFGITIADEDLVPENFNTIEAIAAFVEAKQQQPQNL